MRFTPLFILLFLALAAYGQQISVAVLPSDGATLSNDELEVLTDKMREAALKVLPTNAFVLLKQDVVVKRLGGAEKYIKECSESSCIVDLGKKAQVDYVSQASVGKLGNKIRLKVELYSVRTEGLVGMLNGDAENIDGLLAIVEKKVSVEVFSKIPGAFGGSKASSPSVAGGISDLQVKGVDYKFEGEKRYLANISSDPEGAGLSFNGVPDTRCKTTPCNVELGEGNVRIIAALEQYDMADTTVSIKQNNQSIRIHMKANFGVLEIKPAYSDGIGKDERWNLTINGKAASSWENRLSQNKYKVELSHRCYEDLSFDVGINRDKREVFDMASYVKLKNGGLVLNAERNGEPVSEPVFVNGVQAGETPFSGSVPVCAEIELGKNREKVDVKLKPNEEVVHTVKKIGGVSGGSLTDSRDGKKYKVVKIGTQTWMAENLNYNASGSKCYDNKPANCNKYGRLYNWATTMALDSSCNHGTCFGQLTPKRQDICPKDWHLPTKDEYGQLDDFIGGENTAGKFLKAKSGWNKNGNGEDKFGFSALPGGSGNANGSFGIFGTVLTAGGYGGWWSSSEGNSEYAYILQMHDISDVANYTGGDVKWRLLSVRCVQDTFVVYNAQKATSSIIEPVIQETKNQCDTEMAKAKIIFDKCVQIGKGTAGYSKCIKDYKNQKAKAERACR